MAGRGAVGGVVEIDDRHQGAGGRQTVGHRPPDAAGTAGDERLHPGQVGRHQNPWNHWPAFTPSAWPVIGFDMSEARNTTDSAISLEWGR